MNKCQLTNLLIGFLLVASIPGAASIVSLDEILEKGGFSPSEMVDVKNGKLVKGVMDSLSERELAVKFAFKVPGATISNVPDAFMDSRFKKVDPAVYEVGQVIDHEGDDDCFADFKLEPYTEAALELYRNVGPGDDLNLSSEEIQEFQSLGKKASQEQIENLIRKQLTKRYLQYHKLGMNGISPYQRKGNSYDPGEELAVKTKFMPLLQKHVPEFYNYLVDYPKVPQPEGLVESFSWTVSVLDELPTIALIHKMGYQLDHTIFVFFQRMFYVSRSHNSVQGVGGVFPCGPDDPDCSIVVYGTRTSTDKVAGWGGAAKRKLGARIMSSKQAENFEKLQHIYESTKSEL